MLHEVRAIFLQRVARQPGERVLQLRLRFGDNRALFFKRLARRLELGAKSRGVGGEPRLPHQHQHHRQRAADDRAQKRRGEKIHHAGDCTPLGVTGEGRRRLWVLGAACRVIGAQGGPLE